MLPFITIIVNHELFDYMKDNFLINDKTTTRTPTFITNKISVTGKNREESSSESEFKYNDLLRKNFNTFVEFKDQKKRFGYDSIIGKQNDNQNKPGSYDKMENDRNMFVSRNNYNQIHVHIHNYNIYNKGSYKNSSTPMDSILLESNNDRENIGNMYETPRGSIG